MAGMGAPSTVEDLGSERCESGACHLLLFLPITSFLCLLPISVFFLFLPSFFLLAVFQFLFLTLCFSSKKICDTQREQTSFQGSQYALRAHGLPLPASPIFPVALSLLSLFLCPSDPRPFHVFLSFHQHSAGSSPLDFHTISCGLSRTKGFLGSASRHLRIGLGAK